MPHRFGPFVLDRDRHRVERDGTPFELQPKAFELLALLVESYPRVATRQEITRALWPGITVTDDALAQVVRQLRRGLGESRREGGVVRTVRGYGYALSVPVDAVGGEGGRSSVSSPGSSHRGLRIALAVSLGAIVLLGLWFSRPPQGELPPPLPDLPRHAPGSRSVVVLPFEDLSPDRDQRHFVDGLTEETIHTLAQMEGLQVVAHTSSEAVQKWDLDARAIGARLGVGSLMEGSVRRDGESLRVTAQLIDTSTGSHRWSKSWDRPVGDALVS